jgi:site-specific recombinase XerD
MSSIKLKFKSSNAESTEGLLYYQIIHNRVVRRLYTDYRMFGSEWNSNTQRLIINGSDSKRNLYLMELNNRIRWDVKHFNHIIAKLNQRGYPFESDDIISEYHRVVYEHSLFNFMADIIEQLKQLGKIRTAETYQSTLNSFKQYRDGKDIMLDAITSRDIQLYESYLVKRGLCPNTTSFYMRILRAVYNCAINKGVIVEQGNPFRNVYTGVSKTKKRAINISDIKRIKQMDLSSKLTLAFARDIFLFSFYTRGMAFIDIAYLKKQNLRNGFIIYRRHKTGQELFIKIEKCMQDIIDRYSNPDVDYLFPIIVRNKDEYRQYRNALRRINNKLKEVAEMIGLSINLTTYVGRHSWGSAAKNSNIPISVISECMGHNNEHTTQIYLASLDTSQMDKANEKILRKL